MDQVKLWLGSAARPEATFLSWDAVLTLLGPLREALLQSPILLLASTPPPQSSRLLDKCALPT